MTRALLAGCVMVVGIAGSAQAGATDFFSETVKDFGTTPRGPVLVHYFTVKNTSKVPVTLGTPRVSCGCVSASVLKPTLAPGESTAVVAQMDTRRIPQAGVTKSVTVYVPFLSPMVEEVHLRVQAIARDDLVLSPDTLAFGTVRKGQGGSAATKITVFNSGKWQVTEATSTGIYVKVEAKPAADNGVDIVATLDPACPVGNWTADIWIKTNASGLDKLRIPVTVNVVAPIVANPEATKFDGAKVGEPSEAKVILQGSQPFKVMEVKGGGADLAVKAVAEGARPVHILKVTFTPTSVGTLARTLEIVTDHPDQPKVSVVVSGNAVK